MTTIVTRAGKGSPLTNNEVDSNFTNLNDAKVETSSVSVTDNAVARFDGTTGEILQNSVVTIDDTGNESGLLSQQFSNGSAVTVAAGKQWYDGTTGSWNLGMGGGNITQQVGEELYYYGKASTAITDSPLKIVYKTGTVGASGVITFAPTISGITDGDLILGVATESLTLNSFGRITTFGVVHGITTDGTAYGETWADGDVIWYNPVTGNPTKTKPVAPNIKVAIGTILKAGSGGSGSIQVEINHGSVLGGTDANVQLNGVANNHLLQYDATAGYWKNVATIPNSNLANSSITINGSAISLGGTVSVGTVTSVAALTLGTTGTDLSSSVATGTTTPVITLNVPTASASNRGVLSAADWSTFNGKQAALVSGTNIKTVNGTTLLGSGDVGTIGLAYGGTGKTTAPASLANLMGFTTTATAAGTTTLTNTSSYQQVFTGATTQTIVLPDVTTLALGWTFEVINNSTGNLTVNSSGGNLVGTVYPNTSVSILCVAITGTTAASWDWDYNAFASATGTGSVVLSTSPTLVTPALGTPSSGNFSTGTFTWPTFNQNTTGTASNVTGTVAIANGGTGSTTAAGALTNLGAYAASNPNGYTSNTGTVTSITAGTGLSGGTITTSGTVALANTTVTAGSYTYASITVDGQGRLTAASSGSAPSAFPTGTLMLFQQTAAPTGWTKQTTHNDKSLRIVSGTAGSGGSVAFSTAFASQTPTGAVSVSVGAGTLAVGIGTLSAAATTLSTAQMPSHSHVQYGNVAGGGCSVQPGYANVIVGGGNPSTQNTGGGGSHSHSMSGSPSLSGSPSVSSATFTGSAMNLAVQYVDVIIATKD